LFKYNLSIKNKKNGLSKFWYYVISCSCYTTRNTCFWIFIV